MDATPLRACSPDSLPPLEPSCSDLSDDDEPKHRQPQVEPQPRQEKTLEEYVNEWRSLKEMEEESSRHHAKQAQLAMVARYLDMKIEESKARPVRTLQERLSDWLDGCSDRPLTADDMNDLMRFHGRFETVWRQGPDGRLRIAEPTIARPSIKGRTIAHREVASTKPQASIWNDLHIREVDRGVRQDKLCISPREYIRNFDSGKDENNPAPEKLTTYFRKIRPACIDPAMYGRPTTSKPAKSLLPVAAKSTSSHGSIVQRDSFSFKGIASSLELVDGENDKIKRTEILPGHSVRDKKKHSEKGVEQGEDEKEETDGDDWTLV